MKGTAHKWNRRLPTICVWLFLLLPFFKKICIMFLPLPLTNKRASVYRTSTRIDRCACWCLLDRPSQKKKPAEIKKMKNPEKRSTVAKFNALKISLLPKKKPPDAPCAYQPHTGIEEVEVRVLIRGVGKELN